MDTEGLKVQKDGKMYYATAAEKLPQGNGYAIEVTGKVNINVFSKKLRVHFLWMKDKHYIVLQTPLSSVSMLWPNKRTIPFVIRHFKEKRKEYAHKKCVMKVVNNKGEHVNPWQ